MSLRSWDYFPETNACPMKQKLGRERSTGDHGKWVCGVKTLLQKPGCVVYSIGSDGLTSERLYTSLRIIICIALRPIIIWPIRPTIIEDQLLSKGRWIQTCRWNAAEGYRYISQ